MTGHDPYRGSSPTGGVAAVEDVDQEDAAARQEAVERLQAAGGGEPPSLVVPDAAADAVAWLEDVEAGSPEGLDRAHAALAVEQERPESQRRSTVLAAIQDHLDAAAGASS